MFRALLVLLVIAHFAFATSVAAATCPALPVPLSNGTTANAPDVMADLNSILNCSNTNLAPLVSPTFSGNVGIGLAAIRALDVNGDSTLNGYLNVGSNSVPVNDDVGDITAVRFSAGNHSVTGHGTEVVFDAYGHLTGLTGSGAIASITASISPTADSAEAYRSTWISATYNTSSNLTGSGANSPTSAWFENRIGTAGNIAQANAVSIFGLWVPSGATALGNVTEADAVYIQPVTSFGNTLTSTVSRAFGLHVTDSSKASLIVTGQAGVVIDPLASAANNTSILIGQTTPPSGNFSVYSASTNGSYFAGSVGIGASVPAVKLAVVGDIRVGTSDANGCLQNFAGTAIAGTCSSDARLKAVLGRVAHVLTKLEGIDVVRFKWNDTAIKTYHNSADAINTGVLAQQLEKAFPELVSTDPHGYKQVNYTDLQLYGIEAVKELKAVSDRQERLINRLLQTTETQTHEIAHLHAEIGVLKSQAVIWSARYEGAN